MALQGETTQVSAGHFESVEDTLLDILFSEMEPIEAAEGGHAGYTSREAAEKWHVSETRAQRHLSNAVRAGKVECGPGYRYSPILRREHRTIVYWLKEGTKDEQPT